MIIRTSALRQGRRAFVQSARTLTTASETAPATTASAIPAGYALKHLTPDSVSKTVAEEYHAMQKIKKTTGRLGSEIEPFYMPSKTLNKPVGPEEVTLELLMASQAHMGHSTSLWNPANSRYIYGIRQGIHVISLEQTAAHLRRAAKVIEGVAYAGGTILFVGTRKGQMRSVVGAAHMAKGCHLYDRWIPGAITNSRVILSTSELKVVDAKDEEIVTPVLQDKLSGADPIKPDLVVVLNPLENYICLQECGQAGVPTIGIIDTDANPTWVTYPIPANDDSLRCTNLIAGVLGRAAQEGRKRRLKAVENGQTPFKTPRRLREWVAQDPEFLAEQKKREITQSAN